MLYSAEFNYSKESIIRLFIMEFRTYERRTAFLRLLIGTIIVIFAILLKLPLTVKGIITAVGAWFISSTDFPARLRADENIRKFKGNYPRLKYEFKDSYFTVKDNKSIDIDYGKIEHLIEDNNFIYIFMGRSNVAVLDKTIINGGVKNKDPKISFKEFLEEKSGKKFEKSKSIISLNIFDLMDILKK